MAINDTSTLVVKTGRFYVNAVGTDAPTALDRASLLAEGWEELGHTSLEDILSWATEGGESTTLGSLQSPSLRQTTSARTESFTTTLLQWDEKTLPFYFGGNMELIPGSEIFMGVKSSPEPIRKSFLVVFEDGQNRFPVYAPAASIGRGDDLAIDSTEDLAGLPIQISLLNHAGNDWAFAVAPIGGVSTPGEGDGSGE